jgi:hypothetical protein
VRQSRKTSESHNGNLHPSSSRRLRQFDLYYIRALATIALTPKRRE